jgi:hypothetical protein
MQCLPGEEECYNNYLDSWGENRTLPESRWVNFQKSGLGEEKVREILNLVKPEGGGSLSADEFYRVCRYIWMAQNNINFDNFLWPGGLLCFFCIQTVCRISATKIRYTTRRPKIWRNSVFQISCG